MIMKPLNLETALEIRYERSIKFLLDLALGHSCNRARVAADVLLSANNAQIRPNSNWMLHVPDLSHLDQYSLNAALGVIPDCINDDIRRKSVTFVCIHTPILPILAS
jgi:hypothetical protein